MSELKNEFKDVDQKILAYLREIPPLSPEEQERLKGIAHDARRVFDYMEEFQMGYMSFPWPERSHTTEEYMSELCRPSRDFPEHVFTSDEERKRVIQDFKDRGILPK
jgi:sugar phosphate isomerase/epimerase